MSSIILSTLNARYIHSSLGLRYLKANMQDLYDETEIVEFTINTRPIDIAEELLKRNPEIIGFGVYIWNIQQTTEVIRLLKTIRPELIIVLGGPEVSYEYENQDIFDASDYLIPGQADVTFSALCHDIKSGNSPDTKLVPLKAFHLDELTLPYNEYTDDDIKNRIIYVEASRGCPFKCEFCLSALDKTVTPFKLEKFLEQLGKLYTKGVRHFKFVDRTFNLKVDTSLAILNFFKDKTEDGLFLHFELIPDNLPEPLKECIASFPEHSMQFEIGIQTLNPVVQKNISRKQNKQKTRENLTWLKEHSHVHIHADLILGLPGEDLASIRLGFNELYELSPDEIQVGILKRLKGSPIIRHTSEFEMRYNPMPPYNILSTGLIDFETMQSLNRFARYWDMIANSGRFKTTLPVLLGADPFNNFMDLSHAIFKKTAQTHRISLDRLFSLIHNISRDMQHVNHKQLGELLLQDYQRSGLKGLPKFMNTDESVQANTQSKSSSARQMRHRQ